eukprot:TRINITY_DN10539_c0_g1_i1.p1 TRINITY_DN10539_c0_g1~~TRINITY_DN10539_c0_g1_i1.p1  ORF type:complete len:219 (-),score=44.33 TRINITY_DN10539_c0_g1_i1:59-715(-)
MAMVTVAGEAYQKMVCHAFKYSHAAVNGVLLGTTQSGTAPGEAKGEARSASVAVVDYVPLFHTTTLTPMLEVGFTLIEEHAASRSLEVVGYFHANELFEDRELPSIARTIAAKVAILGPNRIVLLLDSSKANPAQETFALIPFTREQDRWTERAADYADFADPDSFKWADFADLIQPHGTTGHSHALRQFHDLDDHLDDVSKDFFNTSFGATGKIGKK